MRFVYNPPLAVCQRVGGTQDQSEDPFGSVDAPTGSWILEAGHCFGASLFTLKYA